MLTILIVDDEAYIRDGVKDKIVSLGMEQCEFYEASNGIEALKLVSRQQPDIIISDIKMANMNGLEMIRAVRTSRYKPQIIIISGYSDFEFAQQAIELGVIKYILKPIDKGALLEALHIALDHMQRQNMSKSNYNELALYKQKLREAVLEGVQDEYMQLNYQRLFEKLYIVTICFKKTGQDECKKIISMLEVYLSQCSEKYALKSTVFWDYEKKIVVLLDSSEEKSKLCQLLEKIMKRLSYELSILFFGGISSSVDDLDHINELYLQSLQAIKYRLFTENNKVIDYIEVKDKEDLIDIPIMAFKSIKEAVDRDDRKVISEGIEKIFDRKQLGQKSFKCTLKLYESFINYVFFNIVNPSEHLRTKRDITNLFTYDFDSYYSFDEMVVSIKKMMFNICREDCLAKENNYENIIMLKAINFIHENYNRDITLFDVANHVAMSYNYFSKLFKDEAGQSYVNYIKQIRVAKAKELLIDPTISVKDIAEFIGYSSSRHFSKVFMQVTGEQPSKYRKKIILKHD